MTRCIAAYTAPGGSYPAFVNVSILESGEVAITSRPDGTPIDTVRECGITCHPSSDTCSGFCRGTAQQPQRHQYVQPGLTQRVVMSADAWADFQAQIVSRMGAVG